ncbi:hypothetical protein F5144DRAFT_404114 [Chaetomium tenue]|uniref:Uncharacterized protein n=1 Tax=Chaetomium tenue TaxID=1854479 RepID=A0ACB7NUB2_9PEZI|nr:hypothetical protein F5144DRAFT_404114 [Chaetomium globosum]
MAGPVGHDGVAQSHHPLPLALLASLVDVGRCNRRNDALMTARSRILLLSSLFSRGPARSGAARGITHLCDPPPATTLIIPSSGTWNGKSSTKPEGEDWCNVLDDLILRNGFAGRIGEMPASRDGSVSAFRTKAVSLCPVPASSPPLSVLDFLASGRWGMRNLSPAPKRVSLPTSEQGIVVFALSSSPFPTGIYRAVSDLSALFNLARQGEAAVAVSPLAPRFHS